jgi:hypothetical protein
VAALAVLATTVGVGAQWASAVHDDGLFELDGNAVNETKATPAAEGEDWNNVCPTTTPAGSASVQSCQGNTTASAARFVVDAVNAAGKDTTIFTTGGSKDDLDTTQWRHTAGSVPDKDQLTHAYAARYDDTLYFGANRFITNGDAQIGFWFFQRAVGPVAGGTFSGGGHTDGDILVLSDFTNGGGTPTVRVFEWNGPGGAIAGQGTINGTLDLLAGDVLTPADCDVIGTGDNFCATVNDTAQPSPWAYQAKSGAANSFPAGAFYEGGIDLAFLDLEDECFSSFIAETRSSQSVDATLKDFVGGSFASCTASLSTVPSVGAGATVTPGTSVTDTITITGSGVGNPPTPTGTVSFYLCGPLASGVCSSTTTAVGTASLSGSSGTATATSPSVDTSNLTPGRYCFYATWPGDSSYTGGPFSHSGTGDSECFYVAKINTNTVTTPVDGSGATVASIVLGQSIQDKAVVTGTSVGGDPTGLVKFYLCGPADLDPDDTDTCDTGGTQVGSPSGGETLVSDGVSGTYTSSVTSDAVTPAGTGRYCFRADYQGSTVYNTSSDYADTECFNVIKLNSNTVTTPVDGSGVASPVIDIGDSIYDKAVVTGSALGGDPTGTVQFFVCGPADLADASDVCDTGGSQVGSPAAGETLVPDGPGSTYTSTVTSEAVTPTTPGRYCFRAVYSGNTPYYGSEDSNTTECFLVKDNSTTSSAQNWLPNDTATVLLSGGGAASGTVTFTLYPSSDCTGTAIGGQTYSNVALDSNGQASTSNTTYLVTANTTVSWKVDFTPTDSTTVNASSHCETSTVTVNNN